ncbi:STAS domain-containing protein [Celerinatantimonas sp. YJH-8]|uniref:STAS domain-containing protein n=1 Tax=Celerinatantimonas sp. YJH-8 TaxID=3228714 RepID=UPI0038C23E30
MSDLNSVKQWRAPDALTIYEVQEIGAHWIDESQWLCSWQFDLAATAEIDSCGVQLLLYLQRCLKEHDQQLWLYNVQDDVLAALKLMGLEKVLRFEGAGHE